LIGELNVEQKHVGARDERFGDELFGGLRFVDDLDVAVRKKGIKAGADDGVRVGDDETNGHKRSLGRTGVKVERKRKNDFQFGAFSIIPSQGAGVKKSTRFSSEKSGDFSSATAAKREKSPRRGKFGRDAGGNVNDK
jgi:hypothetical protein